MQANTTPNATDFSTLFLTNRFEHGMLRHVKTNPA